MQVNFKIHFSRRFENIKYILNGCKIKLNGLCLKMYLYDKPFMDIWISNLLEL